MSALARRYARALLEAALAHDDLEQVHAAATGLRGLLEEPGLKDLLCHPRTGRAQKLALLAERLGQTGPRPTGLLGAFLGVVIQRRREGFLGPILAEFHSQVLEHRGALEGIVETARPLAQEVGDQLAQTLAQRLGAREALLEIRVRPELLAGLRVHLGGRRFEATASARLQELRSRLLAVPLD